MWSVSTLRSSHVGGAVDVVDILADGRGDGVVVGWRNVVDEAS